MRSVLRAPQKFGLLAAGGMGESALREWELSGVDLPGTGPLKATIGPQVSRSLGSMIGEVAVSSFAVGQCRI